MKRFTVMAAGALALVAGNAFADCSYGKHQAAMADASEAQDAADESLSSELLAKLKRQEEVALEQDALVVPNIPN